MSKSIFSLLLAASCILTMSACSLKRLSDIELPPLPGTAEARMDDEAPPFVEEEKTEEPEECETTYGETDLRETAVPDSEPTPESDGEPELAAGPASEETGQITPAGEPSALQPESAPEPQASFETETQQPEHIPAAIPVISILNATVPTDMERYRSVDLRGVIEADCGVITQVYAVIISAEGDAVQDSAYYPNEKSFNLAGTVNACLRFGLLEPGSYVYQLNASAQNGDGISSATLIQTAFNVNAPAQPQNESQSENHTEAGTVSDAVQYSAKLTDDTSNEGLIWNYLVLQLNNPYAAAGILGNIQAESSCLPYIVENDTSKGRSFSISYTESADSGTISRDTFAYSPPGDSLGYGFGLCQWTMERKGNLYEYAKNGGVSLNSVDTQCGFMMQELYVYFPDLLEYLKTCTDAREACRKFCTDYEKASVWGGRTDYAVKYLDKYAKN